MGFIVNKQEAREASVRFEECVYSFVASHVGQKPSYLQLRDCTRIMVCFCAKMRRGRGEKERGETERERNGWAACRGPDYRILYVTRFIILCSMSRQKHRTTRQRFKTTHFRFILLLLLYYSCYYNTVKFLRESNMQYEIISKLVNKLCLSLSSYLPIVMMEGCEEMHGGGGGRRRRGRREPFRGQK